MAIYAVSYDLRQPGRNYSDLYNAIRGYTHCHMLGSYWYVDTNADAAAIRNDLQRYIDGNDQLIVHEVKKHWAATQRCQCTDWLQDARRSW